jgi:hypothetical protein
MAIWRPREKGGFLRATSLKSRSDPALRRGACLLFFNIPLGFATLSVGGLQRIRFGGGEVGAFIEQRDVPAAATKNMICVSADQGL